MVRITCDCGCGESADEDQKHNWFVVEEVNRPGHETDEPKLSRRVHFRHFSCLIKWARAAELEVPSLQSCARTLSPRGTFRLETANGLYV